MIMSTKKVWVLAAALGAFVSGNVQAQGCSDAGICTINSFKPNSADSAAVGRHQLKVGAFYGQADNAIAVYGTYLEYNRQLSNRWGIDAKLTSLAQNGNGISAFGVSDIFLNAHYKASDKVTFTVGTKIPLSVADKSKNNLPLPMDYQSSLGTVDLIFGMGYTINKWQMVAAIQQPLSQNSNQFLASSYPANHPLRQFQSTNKFQRSADVLLRVSYPVQLHPKLKLTPSLLPIYHLANDRFVNEMDVEQPIVGSQGLTLNGNLYLDYDLSSKSALQFNMGLPFVVRDARPDGLTRSFVANLEYRIRF